jgi:methylenetetrahydrofolate reductase (NADPH)
LLIAGDAPRPIGEFSSTLDVLETGILQESGITRIGVAGHPEGHNAVDTPVLWEALQSKQSFAARAGVSMHIVTQFGLDGSAFGVWEQELVRRRIHLPIRVGIAGPTPIAKLVHFAIQCGIGASMRALRRTIGATVRVPGFATADQHLLGLARTPVSAQIIAPHFFAFGGALETARWMRHVAAGGFDVDVRAAQLRMRAHQPEAPTRL